MDFFEYCEKKSGLDGVEGYLTVQVLCVDAGWRQKGQASSILSRTEELAKEWGFKGLECTCTSVFTSMALKRLGWTKTFSQSYESYTDDEGRPIFYPPPPHKEFSHYVKHIT
jgi:GNAT superfamily N-acetyltransferase